MRNNLVLAVMATMALAAPAIAGEHAALTAEGYGPVKIGMRVDQASKALAVNLRPEEDAPDPECHHVSGGDAAPGLAFMVQHGRIVRVSLYSGPSVIRTDRGIGLGDNMLKVKQTYVAGLADEPHEYLGPTARYLTWWNEKSHRGIRFETDEDGNVDTMHAGNEAIFLVEGCS